SDTGRAQALAAAEYLARIGGVDALVVSPMRRTRETAEAVADKLGLEATVDEGWREVAFGDWDGHTFAEIQQKWPDAMNAWLDSTAVAPPGGESFDTCARRARSARDGLLARYPGK